MPGAPSWAGSRFITSLRDKDRLRAGRDPCLGGDAADGGAMHPEDAGDIGAGAPGCEHAENLGLLMRHQHRASPADAALFASRLETGAGALLKHGTLELGEAAEHLHHHASCRARGVDRLGQGPEASLLSVDPVQDMQEILE